MPGHPIDHAGLEILPFEACLRLLASVPLGRVSFCADGEVVVLPVNHAVDGQDVVFRTARGSKLAAAGEQGLIAFEADDYDRQTRSGWSVLVTGRAEAELVTVRLADGWSVSKHYDLASSDDLEIAPGELAALIAEGSVPNEAVTAWVIRGRVARLSARSPQQSAPGTA